MFANVCDRTGAPRAVLFSLEKTFKTGETMEVRKCVCWQGPGAALSIPGSLATRRQEQQPLAPRTGTFLHPAPLGCRTMTDLLTHTHTQWTTAGYFLCVLIGACSQQAELWALWSLALWLFLGSLTSSPDPDLLYPRSCDIESGSGDSRADRKSVV